LCFRPTSSDNDRWQDRKLDLPLIVALLKAGADPNAIGYDDQAFPLECAALHGHVPVLATLLQFGADVHKADKDGMTALHAALMLDGEAAVKLLLLHKPDVNAATFNGSTPLHFASGLEDPPVILMLLSSGARLNSCNAFGETPLDMALIIPNSTFVKFLESKGAKTGLQLHKRSPAIWDTNLDALKRNVSAKTKQH
jgi:ankyrin repeat protein